VSGNFTWPIPAFGLAQAKPLILRLLDPIVEMAFKSHKVRGFRLCHLRIFGLCFAFVPRTMSQSECRNGPNQAAEVTS
jgi:hypothetical protein